jgi:hypothetical protein
MTMEQPFPNVPPPGTAGAPASRRTLWLAIGAVSVMAVAAVFVLRGGGESATTPTTTTVPSVAPTVTAATPVDGQALTTALAERDAALAEVAVLEARVTELEAQAGAASGAGDAAEVEALRAELAEAVAAVDAAEARAASAEGVLPLTVTDLFVDTIDGVYDVQWDNMIACEDYLECEYASTPFDQVYIATDSVTGLPQLVAPDVVQVPLDTIFTSAWGMGRAINSGSTCPSAPGAVVPADVTVSLELWVIGASPAGIAQIGALVGEIGLLLDPPARCAASYLAWEVTLVRVPS